MVPPMNNELTVTHVEIDNDKNRYRLQSSKYVQSDLKNTYSLVKKNLSEGKIVLYSWDTLSIFGIICISRRR